ncbi:hypothetical protein [Mycobacterium sp. URHB0021]
MPIYVLGPRNRSVVIPNQALTVSISGSVRGASLVVHASGGQETMQPNSQLAVLNRVSERVSITVVPAGGEPFARGTQVSLAIGHDAAGDLDPVQVLFDPVDVSGDSNVELARLTARDGIVEISAAAGMDSPLSPLASAARISARKTLDHHSRTVHGPVLVALDTSASMLPIFASGGAAAAVDIVVGVAAAVGINDVSAVLIGEDAVEVGCGVAAQLAAEVRHAVPRWSAGARWSRLPDAGGRIIICTDFPTRNTLQRFAVITFSDDAHTDSRCVRMPPPRSGLQSDVELLADSSTLDRITASLVRALR